MTPARSNVVQLPAKQAEKPKRRRRSAAEERREREAEIRRLAAKDEVVRLGLRLDWLSHVVDGFEAELRLDPDASVPARRLEAAKLEMSAIKQLMTVLPATTYLGGRLQFELAEDLLCVSEEMTLAQAMETLGALRRLILSARRQALKGQSYIESYCGGRSFKNSFWLFPTDNDHKESKARQNLYWRKVDADLRRKRKALAEGRPTD